MKALESTFSLKKRHFSVIVKIDCETDGSSAALIIFWHSHGVFRAGGVGAGWARPLHQRGKLHQPDLLRHQPTRRARGRLLVPRGEGEGHEDINPQCHIFGTIIECHIVTNQSNYINNLSKSMLLKIYISSVLILGGFLWNNNNSMQAAKLLFSLDQIIDIFERIKCC